MHLFITQAVYEKSIIQCRCHGVSDNCATKICHRQLEPFKLVGKRLLEVYQNSVRVKLQVKKSTGDSTKAKLVEVNTGYTKYTSKDIVYLSDSPTYCQKDLRIGSFGTRGRKCVKNGNALNDCSTLCCGRGYYTRREIIKEKCGCEFIWCCEVRCQICESEQNVHYCK